MQSDNVLPRVTFCICAGVFSVSASAFSVSASAFSVSASAFSVSASAFSLSASAFSLSASVFGVSASAFSVSPCGFSVSAEICLLHGVLLSIHTGSCRLVADTFSVVYTGRLDIGTGILSFATRDRQPCCIALGFHCNFDFALCTAKAQRSKPGNERCPCLLVRLQHIFI